MRPDLSCPGPFGPSGDVDGILHDTNAPRELADLVNPLHCLL